MYEMITLTKRSIKIFLRDKTAVFFSFLSVIILLGLYLLFLKNLYTTPELNEILTKGKVSFLTYSMMISGVLVINTLTLALGNLGNIVNDFDLKLMDAFLVTPVKRSKIILAYYFSSLIITGCFTMLMWFLSIIIIGISSGTWYSGMVILQVSLLLVLYSFISTAFMILLTTFIKSVNAFGAIAGIFGTVIGFMCGIYMPLSIFPKFIQNISSLLPFTHMTILIKQLLLQQSLTDLQGKISAESIEELKVAYSMKEIPIFGMTVDLVWCILVACLLAVGCLIWAKARLSKRIR